MKFNTTSICQLSASLIGLALVGTASAQNPRRVPLVPKHDSAAPERNAQSGGLTATDRQFAMNAARGGMMEVEMGRMAEQQSKSAEVKRIGARMVADHSKANSELMAIAQRKGVKLPAAPARMSKMKGADFDKQYLAMMAEDHRKDLAEFQAEAKTVAIRS